MKVGIVIVSHSAQLSQCVADMVKQMVGRDVPMAHCGGTADGRLGSDVNAITQAIESVWSEAGVIVLVDLGGAEMNSEMAIEKLPPNKRRRTRLTNAPLVEGAVVAATKASIGGSLEEVFHDAEHFLTG
jgi:phosphoenolpyruvate---glycerone phosphotransferase subunit DhaM